MQTIGEKLEEARKQRGISVREASEVTKIRSDYLASFENNSFDINLPEVYIRGFLRAYANFLKVNADKVMTDYNAHQLGESTFVRQKESREFLGRMDIPDESGESSETPAPLAPPRHPPAGPGGGEDRGFNYNNFDRTALIKRGTIFGGAFLFVGVVVFIVLAILRSGPTDITAAQGPIEASGGKELILIATGGNVVSITATEDGTDQVLFRGPLNEGDRQRVPFSDRVRLSFTDAEYLQIEYNGDLSGFDRRGPGRVSFPPRSAR